MRLYKATIEPISAFATPLRGDTLFGQLCWTIRYLHGNDNLKKLLESYSQTPFAIVSDAFPVGYLPKPKLPSWILNEGDNKKQNRKKVWISPQDLEAANYQNAKTTKDAYKLKNTHPETTITMHNSINYKTFTTQEGFDPYGVQEWYILNKDIYLLVDETQISIDKIQNALTFVGKTGYGKDSTVGKGRFEVGEFSEVKPHKPSTAYMALNAFTPNKIECKDIYYDVTTKFGKKGGLYANKNPFKKPILLADTGSAILFETSIQKDFIGASIKGHTSHPEIVHQGYAIVWPIKEFKDEQ